MIATILLTGMIGSMGQAAFAGVPSADIDFEDYCPTDHGTLIDSPIVTADNEVTLKVGDVAPSRDGYTAFVGSPTEAFGTLNIGADTPHNNPSGNDCFYNDDTDPRVTTGPDQVQSFDYFITFKNPVSSLSLDLYDYADDGAGVARVCDGNTENCVIGATATLTGYSNSDYTGVVADDTITTDASFQDGQIENLSIPTQTTWIQSASLTFSVEDRGTGIDNITFDTAIQVEKTWTHTNLNPVICEIIELQEVCHEANVDNDGAENIFPGPLDTDVGDGKAILEVVVHNNGKVTNLVPGQTYAEIKVTVNNAVDELWISDDFADCVDPFLQINPKKNNNAATVILVDPNKDVFDLSDALRDAGKLTVVEEGPAEAHLENVAAGSEVYLYVKFGPSIKGDNWASIALPDRMCENTASVTFDLGDGESDPVEATSAIKVIEKINE